MRNSHLDGIKSVAMVVEFFVSARKRKRITLEIIATLAALYAVYVNAMHSKQLMNESLSLDAQTDSFDATKYTDFCWIGFIAASASVPTDHMFVSVFCLCLTLTVVYRHTSHIYNEWRYYRWFSMWHMRFNNKNTMLHSISSFV